jgi:hypothetical protein
VPYTKVTIGDPNRPTIDAAFLSDTVASRPRGRFEAVILPNDAGGGLTTGEVAALTQYETDFGVRQVDAFNLPGTSVGMTTVGGYEGSLDGLPASVTAAGLAGPFSYLTGQVPIDNYDPNVVESYGVPRRDQPEHHDQRHRLRCRRHRRASDSRVRS